MSVVKWTRAMELALPDLMVDSVRSDLRAESGFKKAAWVQALRMIVTEFPLQSELNYQATHNQASVVQDQVGRMVDHR